MHVICDSTWICKLYVTILLLMAIISFMYYILLLSPTMAPSFEYMYDYINDYPVMAMGRDDDAEEMSYNGYVDSSDKDQQNLRVKRNATTLSTENLPSSAELPETTSQMSTSSNLPTIKSHKKGRKHTGQKATTATTTTEAVEYDPDIRLANVVMDSVFANSDRSNLTRPLGLCRKSADIKLPEFKPILLPPEDAYQVLNCVNDILSRQTKKHLCLELDPGLNAYLRWLLLTGEPRQKHKPLKYGVKDDFLFPTTACVEEVYTPPDQTSECLVQRGFGEDEDDL